jgi:hypothetical protein
MLTNKTLSVKKFLLLTFSVIVVAAVVAHSAWIAVAPNWSFVVVIDKSAYKLGESVQITVSLRNLGFIPHSFTSSCSDPIAVSVSHVYEKDPSIWAQVWYSSYYDSQTEFTIGPHQSLERTFVWNQTNIYHPQEKIDKGTYLIEALIPSAGSFTQPVRVDNAFFWDSIRINITAT